MAIVVLVAVLLVTAASITVACRVAANDGWPGPRPPDPAHGNWSTDLPDHPYAVER